MWVLASRVVSSFVCDTAWVRGFSPKGAWFSRRNRTANLRLQSGIWYQVNNKQDIMILLYSIQDGIVWLRVISILKGELHVIAHCLTSCRQGQPHYFE